MSRCRLCGRYHSGLGFFVNTTLTMASVYLSVWLIFLFALSSSLTVQNGGTAANNTQLISSINTVQIVQLGFLSVLPYWGELCLEAGFLEVRRRRLARLAFSLNASAQAQAWLPGHNTGKHLSRLPAGLAQHHPPDGVR